MLLPFVSLTALTPSDAPPSLASIEGLKPSVIGEVVLRGHDHGIIESVRPDPGLEPPGVVRLKLTERPSSISGGCLRGQWVAIFRHKPGAPERTAVLSNASVSKEVSLPTVSGCAQGEFAHVNPGLSVEEALNALKHLRQVRSGSAKIHFSCSDSTGSTLCQTPKTIRRELTRLPAWAVTKKGEKIEFWLGERGQVVTAVSYSEANPHLISVDRSIPPPF